MATKKLQLHSTFCSYSCVHQALSHDPRATAQDRERRRATGSRERGTQGGLLHGPHDDERSGLGDGNDASASTTAVSTIAEGGSTKIGVGSGKGSKSAMTSASSSVAVMDTVASSSKDKDFVEEVLYSMPCTGVRTHFL